MRIDQKPIIHGRDHLPGGPDPIPGLPNPFGDTVADIILGLDPVGFWKLNELSGTIAHDSSGNGNDMDTAGGFSPPTWGQTAGPPGDVVAFWPDPGVGADTYRESCTLAAKTNNFSSGIWAKLDSSAPANINEILGQGQPSHTQPGWGLAMYWDGGSGGAEFRLKVSDGAVVDTVLGNGPPVLDTWYLLGVTRDSGTWKLYLDGLLQTDNSTQSPSSGSTDTWIGSDAFPGHTSYARKVYMSYAFITDTVLSSVQWLEIYNTGVLGGAVEADEVWTAQGDGTAAWAPARIQVEF